MRAILGDCLYRGNFSPGSDLTGHRDKSVLEASLIPEKKYRNNKSFFSAMNLADDDFLVHWRYSHPSVLDFCFPNVHIIGYIIDPTRIFKGKPSIQP